MAARYQALRDRVVASVDRVFAEGVRLSFMKDGQPDPDRSMVEIEAPLRTGGGQETSVTGGLSQGWRGMIVAGKVELHIDMRAYPDLVVREGDKVRANDRPGKPWFEVLAIDDRDFTRVVLQLGEI